MVISDMLYILKHFNFNLILFFIVKYCRVLYLLSNISVSITAKTLYYRERKRLTNQNGICIFLKKCFQVLSKHWQPSCSIESVRLRYHGLR